MSALDKQIAALNERIAAMRKLLEEAEAWNGEGDTWSAIEALEDLDKEIAGAKKWFSGDVKAISKPFHMLKTLEDTFVYFLDCQLATVEDLQMLARPPKSRLRRHRGIAKKMIERAKAHGIEVSGLSRVVAFECSTQEENEVE